MREGGPLAGPLRGGGPHICVSRPAWTEPSMSRVRHEENPAWDMSELLFVSCKTGHPHFRKHRRVLIKELIVNKEAFNEQLMDI